MKKRQLVVRERAMRDLEERSCYISQHNPAAALRFLEAAKAGLRQLVNMPGLGARYAPDHPLLADLRSFPITRFNRDLIFYRPLADGIEVVRVLHGARDIEAILAEEFDLPGEDDTEH